MSHVNDPSALPQLPILEAVPHRRSFRSRVMTWFVRGYRVLVLVAAMGLLLAAQQRAQQTALGPAVTLAEAQRIFPLAARLGPRDLARNGHVVLSPQGDALGFVLRTSPETDDIVGYAGPNDLLVGLSPDGTVVRVLLSSSGDTPAHVSAVQRGTDFWRQFGGWQPGREPLPAIQGVSGSTLTSLAMGESLQRRLAGPSLSLRFPAAIRFDEVQLFFPNAVAMHDDPRHPGWTVATDRAGASLGYVVRTSPVTDGLIGYQGPTESLFSLATDQQTILQVRLRSSYDTPEYVERVRDSEDFLGRLAGLKIDELHELDFVAAGIEGVSGATQTSYAVAEGLRRRALADAKVAAVATPSLWDRLAWRDAGLLLLIGGALWLTFAKGAGGRRTRFLWQLLLMMGFGIWFGDLLSIALVAGWSRHGLPWGTAPVLVVLASVALAVPWLTKRQIYCHHLCPHGAAQEWLGRFRRWHVHIPARWNRWLGLLPGGLLCAAFLIAVVDVRFDLATLEPFDGWILKFAAPISFSLAIGSLLVACLIPQSYCRFGCPTGALLKFVRSHGGQERFGAAEWTAAAVLLIAAGWLYAPHLWESARTQVLSAPNASSDVRLVGQAFGTSWSVTIRGAIPDPAALHDQLAAELERIESRLSHWRPESETSQFNSSSTTLELEYSEELIQLVAFALRLSSATEGAYDITLGPLVDAWGFGPSGPVEAPPSDAEIQRLLASTGADKLQVSQEFLTLRKAAPDLQLDLGSILQGYSCDRLAELLNSAGVDEFLIDVGGELRSRGEWKVAVENPDGTAGPGASSPRTLILRDAALATSGTYRAMADGKPETRHILSSQTGRPLESPNVLSAVIAPTGQEADAWSTALFSLPPATAQQLAAEHGLSLLLIDRAGKSLATGAFAAKSTRKE